MIDRELELLQGLVEIQEEMALRAVLASIWMQREHPGHQVLSIRPDPTADGELIRMRMRLPLAEYLKWKQTSPDAWRAIIQVSGMGRDCEEQMFALMHWHHRRSEVFYKDSIGCDKFESDSGGAKYTEEEMHDRAIAACVRAGVRPPKWWAKSHCEYCGTLPAHLPGLPCAWCDTFKELHDKNTRREDWCSSESTQDRNEPKRDPKAETRA